jgi:hypothetical protein
LAIRNQSRQELNNNSDLLTRSQINESLALLGAGRYQ